MRLVDTHCHLNFDSYEEDRQEVINRAAEAGVTRIINPAIDLETSHESLNLAQQYPGIYAAVGIHPNSTIAVEDSMLGEVRMLAQQPKVVAIGEIGLDYYWDDSPKTMQFKALEAQLALASDLELPVIIHNREASQDVIEILERWAATLPESLKNRAGVLHSFSASRDIAERAWSAGFYLGFTGPLTYKNADELRHVAAHVPLERIVLETDGPYLTPVPHRGKRNESAYIPYIADRLAALKQISVDQVAETTTANAERLFLLDIE